MTAYTITGATATANVATDFTPNGIPVYPDTLTIGASKTLIIPAGYTFDAVITAGGASTSARANITVSGTWQLKADQTINGWNNILFNAGAVLDGLSGNGLRFSSATATNAQNKITVSGTEANPVYFTRSDYTTGEPASLISATSTTTSQAGLFDCIYLIVNKMASILYGGASISGNHYKLQNVVLDSCGFFTNVLFVNLASDFVFKNVDYRHTHIADVSNSFPLYIGAESSVGTPTGQRVFDGFTASHNDNTSAKILRFQRINYVNNRTNVVIDNVRVDFSTTITTANVFDNWSFRSNFASNNCLFLSDAVQNSMFIMDGTDNIGTGNFHLFDTRIVSTLDSCFIEGIVQSGSITDGSDWFMVPLTGTVNVKNNILIDEKGGVFVNNLGAVGAGLSPSTANVTIEHNTVINKKATATFANPYGTLFRTETNGYYSSGTVSIKSNLNVVLDNLSSDGQVAAMLLVSVTGLGGTIPIDQIDVMDYNNYYNLVTSPPTNLFRNVTTTGKTYGDDGFGMHDKYIAPLFTNYPSRSDRSVILDFATSKGLTSTGQIFTELLKLNGFNETTRKQSASSVSAFNRLDIWNYAKNAVTPSNAVLSTSAHDGTAIGAVQFIAASASVGVTSLGLTSAGLTRAGLTTSGLS